MFGAIPTTTPEETMAKVGAFFTKHQKKSSPLTAVGIGSFGPINLSLQSRDYGKISATPKKGWAGFDIAGHVKQITGADIALNTDVNCALLAEARYGAGRGYQDFIYVTVGTGIGGGIMSDGKLLQGFSHPELGHMLAPKHPDDTDFNGACSFHNDQCIEGLACGPAIEKRWGIKANDMPLDHPAWGLQAHYLAVLCMNLFLLSTPRRIVMGGGVMQQMHLFPMIHEKLSELLAGYIDFDANDMNPQNLVVPAKLGNNAGVCGCMLLAQYHESGKLVA